VKTVRKSVFLQWKALHRDNQFSAASCLARSFSCLYELLYCYG